MYYKTDFHFSLYYHTIPGDSTTQASLLGVY